MLWSATSLGAIAGIPLAAVGVDQVITGARNIAYGKRDRAGVEELVYAATGSETAAVLLPAAATLSLWMIGPRLAGVGLRARAAGTIDFTADIPEVALRDELWTVGGTPYSGVQLARLKNYLENRGVMLIVDSADPRLAGRAGAFRALSGNTGLLLLENGVASQTVWHELAHYLQWRSMGSEAYMALPRLYGNHAPEMFVFEMLQRPGRWHRLSNSYRDSMLEYIEDTWGMMGR